MRSKIDPLLGRLRTVDEKIIERIIESRGGGSTSTGGGTSAPLTIGDAIISAVGSKFLKTNSTGNLIEDNQDYNEFVFNSSGSQSGNRYNTWTDLYAKILTVNGRKTISIEQNEFVNVGSNANFNGVALRGTGTSVLLGGPSFIVNGGNISTWNNCRLEGAVGLLNLTSSPVISNIVWNPDLQEGSIIASHPAGSSEFYYDSFGKEIVVNIADASAVYGSTVGFLNVFNITHASSKINIFLGDNVAKLDNNTIKGTNGRISTYSVSASSNSPVVTQSSFAGISNVALYQAVSSQVKYDNATSGLAATFVKTAIDELASEKVDKDTSDVYTPSNVTTTRTYDADATTLDEVADVLGTLLADLKDRGIVG